jgi:hypothetical protein
MLVTIDDSAKLHDLPEKIKAKIVAACFLCAGAGIALMSIFLRLTN